MQKRMKIMHELISLIDLYKVSVQFSSVQSLSHVQLFAIP